MRRGLEERREVLLEVSLPYAQTRTDPEGATESDGEALSLSGLVDGRGDDEDLDASRGGGRAFGRGLRCGGTDQLQRGNDVRLDALLDRRRLGDDILVPEDAGDRLGLDLGRRAESAKREERSTNLLHVFPHHHVHSPVLGDSPEELCSNSEHLPLAAERSRRTPIDRAADESSERRRHASVGARRLPSRLRPRVKVLQLSISPNSTKGGKKSECTLPSSLNALCPTAPKPN